MGLVWGFDHQGKRYRFLLCEEYRSSQVLRYQVLGSGMELMFQSNEPLLQNRGQKWVKPEWKLIQGAVADAGLSGIIAKLLSWVEVSKVGVYFGWVAIYMVCSV